MIRKITANYIYPVISEPIKNGILVLENNVVVDIVSRDNNVKEIANLEFYGGLIVPGFIDMFVLLSAPYFSADDFKDWNNTGVLKLPKTEIKTTQRAINHLEAFGTKGAVDVFPIEESDTLKKESKVIFSDKKFNLSLPNQEEASSNPLLINRYTLPHNITPNCFSQCVMGTGSLQSHQKLSVFEELKWLQHHFSDISIFELLKWATIQPAELADFNNLGSFKIGKSPGVNLITGVDYDNQQLTSNSELKVLI